MTFGPAAGPSLCPYGSRLGNISSSWAEEKGSPRPHFSTFPFVGSLAVAAPRSEAPWMPLGVLFPAEETAWILVTTHGSLELYVRTALAFLLASLVRDADPMLPALLPGLPLARLRRSRVRRRYSTRQLATGVRREKYRYSDLTASVSFSSQTPLLSFSEDESLVCPGKKRKNAIRHACGVVTKE